jgi:hypothetical protein
VVFLNIKNGGVRKMIIVRMADENSVDDGNVLDIAGLGCVSFRTHEAEWRASVVKDRIEENAQTGRVFDIVASMT